MGLGLYMTDARLRPHSSTQTPVRMRWIITPYVAFGERMVTQIGAQRVFDCQQHPLGHMRTSCPTHLHPLDSCEVHPLTVSYEKSRKQRERAATRPKTIGQRIKAATTPSPPRCNSLVSTRPRCNETLPPSTRSFCLDVCRIQAHHGLISQMARGCCPRHSSIDFWVWPITCCLLSFGCPILDPHFDATRPRCIETQIPIMCSF